MSSLAERAGELVESWPPGGLAAGLLPDPSDPRWAGRAALAVALGAAERRKPALILDLAPEATDLASRFGAADEEGFAELVDGEVELWEIVHRHGAGDAFYLPCGLRTAGAELARSPAARSLADRVRGEGRILLVLLDRRGAGEAASAGWVDGFVRLGDRGVSSARLSGGAGLLGDLERRDSDDDSTVGEGEAAPGSGAGGPGERQRASRRGSGGGRRDGRPPRDRGARTTESGTSSPRLALPRRRRRSRDLLRRVLRTALGAAALIAAGVTASGWLGGPGWDEIGDAAGAVAGDVARVVPSAAGPGGAASDSSVAGRRTDSAGVGDSASSTAAPAPDSGDAPPR